jgi:TrmH family RNA methyltransferase
MSEFKVISSADNAQFKQLKKLAGSARERRKQQQTLLDGVHLIQALSNAKKSPQLLIVRAGSEAQDEIQDCLNRFQQVPRLLLDGKLFDHVSPVETPLGILALLDIEQPQHESYQCAVLLENIQDPGNVGSILRTAAASGAEAVYLSKGSAEAWSPKAMRAAMGAHFVMAIHENADLIAISEKFNTTIATRLDATQSIYDVNLCGKTAFLFGNEGLGLSDELANCATDKVIIPMPGKIESLNVAAATAVCLFERVRQTT